MLVALLNRTAHAIEYASAVGTIAFEWWQIVSESHMALMKLQWTQGGHFAEVHPSAPFQRPYT